MEQQTYLPLRIFVGYDERESIAWHTLCHSIYSRSSRPVTICPINNSNLVGVHNRARDIRQSNSFSFTRFLAPYLSGYEGWAVYMDCDMLMNTDICELFDQYCDPDKAVYVVQHDYESKVRNKYLGNVQYSYPRKNWSSFVLWNCGHAANKTVTPEFVNEAEPAMLHRFLWLEDHEIGSLGVVWNWLVGEYQDPPTDVKNIHWTLGGPYFEGTRNAEFAGLWNEEFHSMIYCEQLKASKEAG
ncbi:glycosyltransferase [Alphaproteobacteria bacterium]|nr:glycosyltransferase [Alphaproteobacteria bacterium]